MVPAMPAADAARAVIGPDDPAAARMAVIGIVGAIVAPVEMAKAVIGRARDAAATDSPPAIVANSAVAIAAAMKRGRGAEATRVEATAAEATDMSSATVEAAAAMEAAAMAATTMSTAAAAVANRDHIVTCGLRRRQRRRIDWSHRFSRTRGSGRQHQRRGGRNSEQAHRACPETQYSQHGLLPESGQRSCDARFRLASSLYIGGRSQD